MQTAIASGQFENSVFEICAIKENSHLIARCPSGLRILNILRYKICVSSSILALNIAHLPSFLNTSDLLKQPSSA